MLSQLTACPVSSAGFSSGLHRRVVGAANRIAKPLNTSGHTLAPSGDSEKAANDQRCSWGRNAFLALRRRKVRQDARLLRCFGGGERRGRRWARHTFAQARAGAELRAANERGALCRRAQIRAAAGAGTLRSGARQGFLRRRLHRRHQGPQVAQDRRGRAHHPLQSRASRRGRRRSARRRRRRHPGADPAQVLRPEGGAARLQPCRSPANTPSARCSCRAIPTGGR